MTSREHLKPLRAQLTAARPDVLTGNRVTGADRKRKLLAGRLIREQFQQGKMAEEMLFSLAAAVVKADSNALPAAFEASAPAGLHDGWPFRENSGLIEGAGIARNWRQSH